MEFGFLKEKAMRRLEKAKKEGEVDEDVVPLLDFINSQPGMFSTSSCSGRICVMFVPSKSKKDAEFVGKWHHETTIDKVLKTINSKRGELWFKMEPFILHVSCKDLETARKVLEAKNNAGVKRGGVFSIKPDRIQIELRGTQWMGFPVKKDNDLLMTEEYLEEAVSVANKKLRLNAEQRERFFKELRKVFS